MPSVAPSSIGAGGTLVISATGLTRSVPYLVYLSGACSLASSPVFLGPHDELSPDSYGNIAPFEVELPGDTSIAAGGCSIVLQSADGAETTSQAPISVTSSGTPCTPNPGDGGLYEDLDANGCQRHHLPSQVGAKELMQRLGVSKEALKKCLPAIRMKREDHSQTGSWGYSTGKTDPERNSVQFRADERREISEAGDSIAKAFELGARDVARKFPKHEAAVEAARQALDRFDDCIRRHGGTPTTG